MAQNKLNDEGTLFQRIKDVPRNEILLMTNSKSERRLISFIKNDTIWTNNATDTNNPPDLYIDKYKMMADLMMVDDNGHYITTKDGEQKYINKEREATSKLYKQLCGKDAAETFPDIGELLLVADTSHIPTNEHHCFEWYYKEFKRIVEEHIKSIKIYKQKFPAYKTIFFIVDESTSYIRTKCLPKDVDINKPTLTDIQDIHFPFWDSSFLDVLKGTTQTDDGLTVGIDYVVWYMPYKFIKTTNGMLKILPTIAVLDVIKIQKIKTFKYDIDHMISTER